MGFKLKKWSFFVMLWVFSVHFVISSVDAICDVQGCNCTVKAAAWKTINCTLRGDQDLILGPLLIPKHVVEMYISGGQKITLGQKAFNSLMGLNLVRIDGAQNLVLDKQSFHDLTSASLLIQIQNCDQLKIKTGAFENVQSTIVTEIGRCASVDVEGSTFSKLLNIRFEDIGRLKVATGTFELRNQGILGRHGPVTTIHFDNVTIPNIPQKTFSSALAEIRVKNSRINSIEKDAISTSQISSISFTHTEIGLLQEGAFGPTLIYNFKISNCTINKIESKAVMAGIGNLTVQHSRITDIFAGAINSTVAKVEIVGNEIVNFHTSGFVFQNWNEILMEQNIIKFLYSGFIVAPINPEVESFSFKDNDVYNLEPGALNFVPEIPDSVFVFKNNFFNQTCHCQIDEWVEELLTVNATTKIKIIVNNTFCTVNELLAQCFELAPGLMNIQNFTELVCSRTEILCTRYSGETKIVNTTSKIFAAHDIHADKTWIIIIISASLLIVAAIITFCILMIRGSRWLKGKGYFRKIHYNQNEHSNDEENTIETVDESEKLEISEDLSLELLQDLSKKLDDPNTHQEASEMIEQLYQKYIRNSTDNNNHQQEEEAHLYEELGNLQQPQSEQDKLENGARGILQLMQEKFNTHFEDIDADVRPALVGDYSEPTDAAVHLYSELKQNSKDTESDNKDSLKSRGSSNMAFRPLPDKPGSSKML